MNAINHDRSLESARNIVEAKCIDWATKQLLLYLYLFGTDTT